MIEQDAVKERPILFSAPMVRAILDGRKTQTRRVVKYPRSTGAFVCVNCGGGWWPYVSIDGESLIDRNGNESPMGCPFGKVGDRLWVRETFAIENDREYVYESFHKLPTDGRPIRTIGAEDEDEDDDLHHLIPRYRATEPDTILEIREVDSDDPFDQMVWTPSIHMPRWASRITLEITDVRVQRLQEISEEDAKAEGSYLDRCSCMPRSEDRSPLRASFQLEWCHVHGQEFSYLWKSINGKESWDANPWVWALTFKRVHP